MASLTTPSFSSDKQEAAYHALGTTTRRGAQASGRQGHRTGRTDSVATRAFARIRTNVDGSTTAERTTTRGEW